MCFGGPPEILLTGDEDDLNEFLHNLQNQSDISRNLAKLYPDEYYDGTKNIKFIKDRKSNKTKGIIYFSNHEIVNLFNEFPTLIIYRNIRPEILDHKNNPCLIVQNNHSKSGITWLINSF